MCVKQTNKHPQATVDVKIQGKSHKLPSKPRQARSSVLTNVICTVADVGRDLLYTLVIQHSLLLRERTGKLLIDSSASTETADIMAAAF